MRDIVRSLRFNLNRKVLYPLYQYKAFYDYRYGYKIIKLLENLNRSQWFSQERLIEYQNDKLKKLLTHVCTNVPYYRELMKKKGLQPADFKSVRDLGHFPILTKEIIRKNADRMMSMDLRTRRYFRDCTGGSTGEPLTYYRDINSVAWAEAALLRGKSYAGYKLGDRSINFMTSGSPSFLGKVRAGLINAYYFPAFGGEQDLLKRLNKVRSLNPYCMESYPSKLYQIAAICKRKGINDIRIPVTFTTGEMLYDHQREAIEKQFNSEVFDYYGCNEIGSLAYECEHHSRHITDEHVIVEITDSKGLPVADSYGEITVTDLDNFAMPFIRYKNNDIGILNGEICRCGRGLTRLQSLEGRSQEFLKTMSGEFLPGIYFPVHFRYLKGFDQYQIIQPDVGNIILKVVKNKLFSDDELNYMIGIIRKGIGSRVKVDVDECDNIALTGHGKNRLVISLVAKEF